MFIELKGSTWPGLICLLTKKRKEVSINHLSPAINLTLAVLASYNILFEASFNPVVVLGHTVLNNFPTQYNHDNATEIVEIVGCRCSFNKIIKFWRCLFFYNINSFRHLACLERTNDSAAQGFNKQLVVNVRSIKYVSI